MKDEDKFYEVDADIKTCTCPDFNYRLLKCKHIIATKFVGELAEGVPAAQNPMNFITARPTV